MDVETRQQKLEKIEKRFGELFCFSTEDRDRYIERVRKFPDQGLDDFLELLTKALDQQNEFFAGIIRQNPSFPKDFARFLNQATARIKGQFEAKEQGKAENILKEM